MTSFALQRIGPGGQAVPTQVHTLGNDQFQAEFVPRAVGEHKVAVSVNRVPTAGSPYAAKVYDVKAIKVKKSPTGVVGKAVTFLGKFVWLLRNEHMTAQNVLQFQFLLWITQI